MSINVIRPGLLATIQDLGRVGVQKYGIIVSGAMDQLSLRMANLLVGNGQDEAAIEITLYGTAFTFNHDHLIAITGGDLQPTLNDAPIPMWRPILVKKGSTLTFNSAVSGCRSYVAIAGGFNVPKELGSKSTYMRAKIGGFKGRALKKGDVLEIDCLSDRNQLFVEQFQSIHSYPTWYINHSEFYSFQQIEKIRIIKGSEYEFFNEKSKQSFTNDHYQLTLEADRMGFKFEGQPLELNQAREFLSEGVTYGTIQVPANGQPIILMADRQTTGGYPKIGQVISADLPKLAQLQPNHQVTFEIVSIQEAEKALLQLENHLKEILLGINLKARTGGIAL